MDKFARLVEDLEGQEGLSSELEAYRSDLVWMRDAEVGFEERVSGKGDKTVRWFVEAAEDEMERNAEEVDGRAGAASGAGGARGRPEGASKEVVIKLGRTHGEMIRFRGKDDEAYRKVMDCLFILMAEIEER